MTDKTKNKILWTIQVLLAILFLFAGVMKLILPIEAMTKDVALPGWFLRFIGVSEVLGALALILPGLLRIRRELTPLAAAGLSIITIGATVITLGTNGVAMALMPLVAALLSAFVVYGRWVWFGSSKLPKLTSASSSKLRSVA